MENASLEMSKIIDAMEIVYTFVMENHDKYTALHDYGNGEKLSMVEAHTLTLIADNPGILVTGVAKMWNRTLSSASQNVNRLVKKGLVEKRKENGNQKSIHLYVTESGQRLSDLHKAYDRQELEHSARELLIRHSTDELDTACQVMKSMLDIKDRIALPNQV